VQATCELHRPRLAMRAPRGTRRGARPARPVGVTVQFESKQQAKRLVSGLRREIRALGATASSLGHNATCDLLARALGFSSWSAFLVTQPWNDMKPEASVNNLCSTPDLISQRKGPVFCRCDNCEKLWPLEQLKPSKRLGERMDLPPDHPDAIVPDGDCPDCGAFCYKVAESEDAKLEEANRRIRTLQRLLLVETCTCGAPREYVDPQKHDRFCRYVELTRTNSEG